MSVTDLLLNSIFPKHCCVCDGITVGKRPVCRKCESEVPDFSAIKRPCECCGLSKAQCVCAKHKYVDKLCFPLFYKDKTRRTLKKLKFSGRTDLARPYAILICEAINKRGLKNDIDVITYVPMTQSAVRKRGYNQAQLLAEQVARLLNLPCEELLIKVLDTAKQYSLGAFRRRGNVLGAFDANPDVTDKVNGKRILLIDDISTGGATMNEAAKTLLIFGAKSVFGACAAVTLKKKRR